MTKMSTSELELTTLITTWNPSTTINPEIAILSATLFNNVVMSTSKLLKSHTRANKIIWVCSVLWACQAANCIPSLSKWPVISQGLGKWLWWLVFPRSPLLPSLLLISPLLIATVPHSKMGRESVEQHLTHFREKNCLHECRALPKPVSTLAKRYGECEKRNYRM